jgi:hypothetical protein
MMTEQGTENQTTEEAPLDQELTGSPETYGPLVPENPGRWLVDTKRGIALWTDDEGAAGVFHTAWDDDSKALASVFLDMRRLGVSATLAYEVAAGKAGMDSAESATGSLSELAETVKEMRE